MGRRRPLTQAQDYADMVNSVKKCDYLTLSVSTWRVGLSSFVHPGWRIEALPRYTEPAETPCAVHSYVYRL